MNQQLQTAIGLMSGTSMDGIDVALLRTDGRQRIEFGPVLAVEYRPDFRRRIEQGLLDVVGILNRKDRPGMLHQLEQELTDWHAQAVMQFLSANNLTPDAIDLLGFHGQTLLHRPELGLTVQLGDGGRLAQATDIDVVHDFRAADMVAGGQGAPLVPVFHRLLAAQITADAPICFVNIGGISNITYVDEDRLMAFDSGPGNALIDQWVHSCGGIPYDQGGRIAAEGSVIQPIVERYLTAPFFDRSGPKSLDRGDFAPSTATMSPSRSAFTMKAQTSPMPTALFVFILRRSNRRSSCRS